MKKDIQHFVGAMNRRVFMRNSLYGLGTAALSSLTGGLGLESLLNGEDFSLPHFAPKVKRVIYLLQSGAPSQFELFDYKPKLKEMFGQELPASVRGEQRVTGMTAHQRSFPLAMGDFTFQQYGKSGAWLSNLLPHHQKIVDDVCFIKSMYTCLLYTSPSPRDA